MKRIIKLIVLLAPFFILVYLFWILDESKTNSKNLFFILCEVIYFCIYIGIAKMGEENKFFSKWILFRV
jgi:hypothetical protein